MIAQTAGSGCRIPYTKGLRVASDFGDCLQGQVVSSGQFKDRMRPGTSLFASGCGIRMFPCVCCELHRAYGPASKHVFEMAIS